MEFRCTWFRAILLLFGQFFFFVFFGFPCICATLYIIVSVIKGESPITALIALPIPLIIAFLFGFYAYCCIKHFLWDKDSVLTFNKEMEFVYKHGEYSLTFSGEEVKEWKFGGIIERWPTARFKDIFFKSNGKQLLTIGYIKMTLKDGTTIYMTRFLDRAIDCIYENYEYLYMPKPDLDFGPLREALFTNFIPKAKVEE